MECNKKWKKGVYTVEASILIPLLLIVMAAGMKIGINLYTEIREEKEAEKIVAMWEVGDFYKSYWIGEVIHE